MLKQYFVKQGIKEAEIEDYIRKIFPLGDYSRTEIQRTPLGIKVVIYTNKPGRIIGKGGKNINDMTDAIKQKFGLENPQLDVKAVRNPDLDPRIVAKQIASAIEKGYSYKKIGNLTIKRIMESGAIGAQIIIAGKLGGGKSMTGKFQEGYMKYCGQPAKDLVDYAFEEAVVKLGKIGIKVRIMTEFMDITGEIIDKKEMLRRKERVVQESMEDMEKREVKEKEERLKVAREAKAKIEIELRPEPKADLSAEIEAVVKHKPKAAKKAKPAEKKAEPKAAAKKAEKEDSKAQETHGEEKPAAPKK